MELSDGVIIGGLSDGVIIGGLSDGAIIYQDSK